MDVANGVQYSSRKLLERCSSGDKLMGEAPMWLSVIIILLLGFLTGLVVGAVFMHTRQKRNLSTSCYPPTMGNAGESYMGWLPIAWRHKREYPQVPSPAGPLSSSLQSSTILNTVINIDSPGFVPSTGIPAPPGLEATDLALQPIITDADLSHQHSLAKQGSTIKAFSAELDAIPREAPQDTRKDPNQKNRLAEKAKIVERIAPAYDLDELDDDWKDLLDQIDAELLTMHKQTMDSKERAVAIRSLLVSTARETPEQAILKAIQDVERFRRVHLK